MASPADRGILGGDVELVTSTPRAYLHHCSAKGEFVLSSDSVIPTFTRSSQIAHITQLVPAIERAKFNERAYTIGAIRYAAFFALFRDFRGYVDFFLLQDLVTADYSTVRHFLPFDGFHPWPLPDSDDAYRVYRQNAETFIDSACQPVSSGRLEAGRTWSPRHWIRRAILLNSFG